MKQIPSETSRRLKPISHGKQYPHCLKMLVWCGAAVLSLAVMTMSVLWLADFVGSIWGLVILIIGIFIIAGVGVTVADVINVRKHR